jgi:hypothetical protein
MNKDDIIKLAIEANGTDFVPANELGLVRLERFAALVAAAEREACALICEKISDQNCGHIELDAAAEQVRARGQL